MTRIDGALWTAVNETISRSASVACAHVRTARAASVA